MPAERVTVAMDNKVPAKEAAETLGCSYSHMINIIKSKKLKAQQISGKWFVDYGDLQHAKSTNLVSPRGKSGSSKVKSLPIPQDRDVVEIKLTIPRDKFELIKLAFRSSNKTLVEVLNEKLDTMYDEVQKKLAGITF